LAAVLLATVGFAVAVSAVFDGCGHEAKVDSSMNGRDVRYI
jgi:hypothetical protein